MVRCRETMSRAAVSCLEMVEMAVEGGVVVGRRVLSESCIYGMGGRGGCELTCAADVCQ